MSKNKLVFISDIHLGSKNEPRFFSFIDLLKTLETDGTTHLFMVGDIFDFWIGNKKIFIDRYQEAINAVNGLVSNGVKVIYFQGNHDVDLKRYWGKKLGVDVYTKPTTFNFNQTKIRVEHGDNFDPDDTGYFIWKAILTSNFLSGLAMIVPSPVVGRISDFLSSKSREYSDKDRESHKVAILEKLHKYVQLQAEKEDFDFIITGHIHYKDSYRFELDGKDIQSINLGTWLHDSQKWVYRLEV